MKEAVHIFIVFYMFVITETKQASLNEKLQLFSLSLPHG